MTLSHAPCTGISRRGPPPAIHAPHDPKRGHESTSSTRPSNTTRVPTDQWPPRRGTGQPPLRGSWHEPTLNCRRRPIRNITVRTSRATWLTAGGPVPVWLQSPTQYAAYKFTWPSGIPQMYSSHGYPQVLTDDLRNPELERTRLYGVSAPKKSRWTYPNLFKPDWLVKAGPYGAKSSRLRITSYRTTLTAPRSNFESVRRVKWQPSLGPPRRHPTSPRSCGPFPVNPRIISHKPAVRHQ